ncbi:MAG TPA: TetR/AcrR family transcriptional regulator [Candidatus Corynebacterium avicola]|uniref:TetR/AcrR family transcriptional regulator n=1 Tax=Candidatus Corynebacterium avicola TaxID=2838527 RepID=A0A9D1RPW2_9CORY|nr:TetR/AcrR family transcriptional regulator [Candidatus Corynebacterium avicola]
MSTPHAEPQQQRSRETRQSLLSAALRVLTNEGLRGTTVSAVAAQAGVSRGAAQHHFPTRDALIEATVAHFYAKVTQQLRSSVANLGAGQYAAPVNDVISLVVESFSSDSFHAALHVWSAAAGPESDLRDLIIAADTRYAREVYQLMALALDADLSDQHTRRLLRSTIDFARGLGLGAVLVDNVEHRTTVTTTWSDILDSGIRRNS